ncbi:hypothetical protein CGC20_39620 [Leishmania donovani]|uniref:Uncharacterized protein n=1 Tax=Leishmania donovani TaxID=5661 RepID=A0A504Y331_LEIDO|nr:hypothetical protein CGC20_39620 [Leishmania donovani]
MSGGGLRNGQGRVSGAADGATVHLREEGVSATGIHLVATSADRIPAVHLRAIGAPPAEARWAEVAAALEARDLAGLRGGAESGGTVRSDGSNIEGARCGHRGDIASGEGFRRLG